MNATMQARETLSLIVRVGVNETSKLEVHRRL
jgi:hypothetical protein